MQATCQSKCILRFLCLFSGVAIFSSHLHSVAKSSYWQSRFFRWIQEGFEFIQRLLLPTQRGFICVINTWPPLDLGDIFDSFFLQSFPSKPCQFLLRSQISPLPCIIPGIHPDSSSPPRLIARTLTGPHFQYFQSHSLFPPRNQVVF